ncbi:hypothetical protein QOZ80_2AG0105240 [Eleusine coracana subsp. coracana]|nr:hypothetical protein QOZ80_2AG0105240 [Eleusine coracana subsp. coracana]
MEDTNYDLDKQNEAQEFHVNVPQDAQGIILSFLPGRVVVKLRILCKFWRDIVEEPSFVDRHLSNSLRFHQSIACFTSLDHGLAHMYTFDPTSMNFTSAELVLSDRFHMSAPCNGLVCAYDYKGNAEVLNPTLQRQLSLPVSGLILQSLSSEYFLGFVHSTKEYKVVSVRHRMQFLTFEICTIGTLSWRIARESAELLKTTKAVIVNDAIYWLLLHEASSVLCREILMLNLTDEQFSKIALPHAAKGHDLALLEGEGKLHLVSTPAYGSNDTVSDIWVLDSTEQIWVQSETVAPRLPAGMSLFFLCKMKIFCGSQHQLFCVDLLDGKISYIPMPSGETLISCGTFVESFAPAAIGLLNSTASSSSTGASLTELSSAQTGPSSCGAGSSTRVLRRSCDVIGWSKSDLEQSLERAKRTVNMEWKVSERGLFHR